MDNSPELVWQDREVRFDDKPQNLACRKGERVIDSINSVEDTKGNNGERGSLVVTNLRLIWVAHFSSKVNLSIGLNCILSVNIKKAKSKLRGHTQALCVLAKTTSRFEFVFTSLVKNSPRLFTTVQAVMRAYETSKLYRDLKLRGSVIKDGELIVLPQEKVFSKITGVWNLSSDQGNLGCVYLTNVRLVWFANLANNFNVSLPYMQMKSIRVRESKFGKALVIETYARAGGYILGFRIDPVDRLEPAVKEITNIYKVYSTTPVFGVDFHLESEAPPVQQLIQPRVEEDTEIIEESEEVPSMAAYLADMSSTEAEDSRSDYIQYSNELGLAIETLQDGITMDQLWRVI